MARPIADPAKSHAAGFIDRNAPAFITLNDSIFYFGEVGMQEHRTAGLMTAILERHGFAIERGISGFETSFIATYGQGKPVVAIHTEYDANPSNSQKAGVTQPDEIVPGAPGHCEGHNVNAAVMVASALAIRYAMEEFGLKGTLKIFGASAEEQLLSRPYFVRDGHFDDVSWKVPMGRLWFPANVPHLPFHHWSAGAPLATSIAHKGGLAGAKALATSVIEYFQKPALVEQTKDSFRRELGGVVYRPLLPDGQRAPAHLNANLMAQYRSAMEAHYLDHEPEFVAH